MNGWVSEQASTYIHIYREREGDEGESAKKTSLYIGRNNEVPSLTQEMMRIDEAQESRLG